MANKIEQIIPLTKEGSWARRLVIRPSSKGWILFEIQQHQEGKWVIEYPTYSFQLKYVKNIPDKLTQVLNEAGNI